MPRKQFEKYICDLCGRSAETTTGKPHKWTFFERDGYENGILEYIVCDNCTQEIVKQAMPTKSKSVKNL